MTAIRLIVWLAWKEYWRGYRHPPGTQYDFQWLTVLVGALTALGLLLLSANEGLLRGYADSMLGYVKGHGFPIMVRAEIGRGKRIDRDLVRDHQLYPFLEVDLDSLVAPLVRHDDPTRPPEQQMPPEFKGWAVYRDDPLWRWAHDFAHIPVETAAFPSQIILVKNAFKGFDYPQYKQAVLAEVPEPVATATFAAKATQLKVFWIEFPRVGAVPFDVVWVDNIPSPIALAYLLPMDTVHLGETMQHLDLIHYPGVTEEQDPHLQDVGLWPAPGEQDLAEQFTGKLSECMAQVGASPQKLQIAFGKFPPLSWVKACAAWVKLPDTIELRPTPVVAVPVERLDLRAGGGVLRVPCASLKPDDLDKRQNPVNCAGGGQGTHTPVGTYDSLLYDYKGGVRYGPERSKITAVAKALTEVKDARGSLVFRLDPAYEMSLRRVTYLSEVTDAASFWIAVIAIAFAIYLLLHALELVIEHRQKYYGTLMANGLTVPQLHAMLLVELTQAWIVGGLVFGSGLELGKRLINYYFAGSEMARLGRETLAITRTEILPPADLSVFLEVWCGTFLFAAVIALLVGWNRFPKNNEASKLMLS